MRDARRLDALADAGLRFQTVVDSAMFHVVGDAERDLLVAGLGAVVEPSGLHCVLGDRRYDRRAVYGLSPVEIAARFDRVSGWELAFAVKSGVERRGVTTPAYFVGVRRRAR